MSQTAVVTGGNKGIGLEIARALIAAGFRVAIAARDEGRGRLAAQELGCELLLLDLDSAASVAACAGEVVRRYGQIDVLVNNAAMAYKHSDTTPWTRKTRNTVATNFFGTAAVCQALAPLLRAGGRMVTVASGSGHLRILRSEELRQEFAGADSGQLTVERLAELMRQFVADVEAGTPPTVSAPLPGALHEQRGWPGHAYGVSKLGQIALAKVYARELSARGVASCACDPGDCQTDMSSHRGSRTAAQGADTPAWLACQPPSAISGRLFRDRAEVGW